MRTEAGLEQFCKGCGNMTESEAITKLKRKAYRTTCYGDKVLEHEENLVAIEALEKQIPKKPRNERSSVPLSRTSVRFVDWYKCGKCNFDLSKQFVCCPYCQSVIDWSDVD